MQKMNYDNYIELYEAVYFFDRIYLYFDKKMPAKSDMERIEKMGITQNVFIAVLKILFVNRLLEYDGKQFKLTDENKQKLQSILENIKKEDKIQHYETLFNKATNKSQYFFDSISEEEYEVYSRYNFEITYQNGKNIAEVIDFDNKKVIEIGGNSGGLGTAILKKYKNTRYTIVDTKIPCTVGDELKKLNNVDICFLEGDAFNLKIPQKVYDYVIFMNFLHDFDDSKCLEILRNIKKYTHKNTRFIIIEDILKGEFEPKEVVMHGLRLCTECRGGRQRTIEELDNIFLKINFKSEESLKLDSVHTILVMGSI